MALPPVVSAAEYEAARAELLVQEKEATRLLDRLAAQRRRLPMTSFRTDYTFRGPAGQVSLLDLFEGRQQLVVYQMMDNGPDDYCTGCASFADNVGHLAQLWERDTSFTIVSDMPWPQIEAYWKRMEWRMPVHSSRDTSFSTDTGADGGFQLTVFLRDGTDVYRTYATNARGVDRLRFDANILDLTPYGRQETWEDSPAGWPQTPPYEWWRLHDEYPQHPNTSR